MKLMRAAFLLLLAIACHGQAKTKNDHSALHKKLKGHKRNKAVKEDTGSTAAHGLSTLLAAVLMNKGKDAYGNQIPADPMTIFAPSDRALAAANLGMSDFDALVSTLKNHVVRGQALTAKQLSNLSPKENLKSWEGFPFKIQKGIKGKQMHVNGVRVLHSDAFVSANAVVHVLDSVLPLPLADSIVDTVSARPMLSSLVGLLSDPAQSTVLTALGGEGPFTVFAPVNRAFKGLEIKDDPAAIGEILKFHVIPGAAVFSHDLKDSQTVTAYNSGKLRIEKGEDGSITVNGAKVVAKDIKADNGVIHLIDSVLLPLGTIVDVAVDTPQLSDLVTILTAPGLEDELTGLTSQGFFNERPAVWGPFTVFAPVNSAFPDELMAKGDFASLRDTIRYHIIPGDIFSEDIGATQRLWALGGDMLTIRKEGSNVFVNDAKVLLADIKTSNGVVHLIDSILVPEERTSTASGEVGEVALDALQWDVINDSIMGGVSRSSVKLTEDDASSAPVIDFSGFVTRDSNGGYASAYGRFGADPVSFAECDSISFRAKGDGARYEMSIGSGVGMVRNGGSRFVAFYPEEDWAEFEFDLSEFSQKTGQISSQQTTFDLTDITSVGLVRTAFLDSMRRNIDPDFSAGPFGVSIKELRCVGKPAPEGVTTMNVEELRWEVINDSVMGGISRSSVNAMPKRGAIEFSGTTTTDSNGGFTNSNGYFMTPVDLSPCETLRFEAKGDQTRYTLSLTSGKRNMFGGSSSVQADFYPTKKWSEVAISMSEMAEPVNFAGFVQPAYDPTATSSVGISHSAFISGLTKDPDFESGPFQIMVRNMKCDHASSGSQKLPEDMAWEVINDTVMGGISRSNVKMLADGVVEFSGTTTTDSNGGFTNSYGRFADEDLSACTALRFQAKGDMTRYKLSLISGQMSRFGGSSTIEGMFYPPEEWTTITVDIDDMKEPAGLGFGMAPPPFNIAATNGLGVSHSAFLDGLTKDPDFKSGPFSVMMRDFECLVGA